MDYSTLPDLVLIHIFENLSVNNIKSCRLVCKKWYRCCNYTTILVKMKYVFRNVYSVVEINNFLVKTFDFTISENIGKMQAFENSPKRGYSMSPKLLSISVEFIGISLEQLDWKKFGSKITELRITNCKMTVEILRNLFHCTPNLHFFNYNMRKYNYRDLNSSLLDEGILEEILNILEKDQFQNENLQSLLFENLSDNEKLIKNKFFYATGMQKLSNIFPSISFINFGRIYEYIKDENFNLGSKIKRLHMAKDDVMDWHVIRRLPKLEELSMEGCIVVGHQVTPYEQILTCEQFVAFKQFISYQSELETLFLTISIHYRIPLVTKMKLHEYMLRYILENCRKLKHLYFNPFYQFQFEDGCMEEFIMLMPHLETLHLKHLCCTCKSEVYDNQNLISNNICATPNLKSLRLALPCNMQVLNSLLSQCQLQDLHLDHSLRSSINLWETLRMQKNSLRMLKITKNGFAELYDMPYFGEGKLYLNKLEYFKVHWPDNNVTRFIKFLENCPFPNLSTAIIGRFYRDSLPGVLNWLGNMPLLRKIEITCNSLNFDECIQFCSRMKKLERITWLSNLRWHSVTNNEDPYREEVIELFTKCQTLKFANYHYLTYYYCRITKRLFRSINEWNPFKVI